MLPTATIERVTIDRSTNGGSSWTALDPGYHRDDSSTGWSGTANLHWMLDVEIDPSFATNQLVYFSFSEPHGADAARTNNTAVARGRLVEGPPARVENVQVIYRQQPKVRSGGHYGSRLVFSRDGKLFITQGDRQSPSFRQQAQSLSSGIGKVIRVNPDGSIPSDNPFVRRDDARPEIWSYGHRNIEGLALGPRLADGEPAAGAGAGPDRHSRLDLLRRGFVHRDVSTPPQSRQTCRATPLGRADAPVGRARV